MGAASAPPTRAAIRGGHSCPCPSSPTRSSAIASTDSAISRPLWAAASPATRGSRLNHGLSTAPQARPTSLRVSCVSICPVCHVCVADICTVCRKNYCSALDTSWVARPQAGGRQPREVHRSFRAPRGARDPLVFSTPCSLSSLVADSLPEAWIVELLLLRFLLACSQPKELQGCLHDLHHALASVGQRAGFAKRPRPPPSAVQLDTLRATFSQLRPTSGPSILCHLHPPSSLAVPLCDPLAGQ